MAFTRFVSHIACAVPIQDYFTTLCMKCELLFCRYLKDHLLLHYLVHQFSSNLEQQSWCPHPQKSGEQLLDIGSFLWWLQENTLPNLSATWNLKGTMSKCFCTSRFFIEFNLFALLSPCFYVLWFYICFYATVC